MRTDPDVPDGKLGAVPQDVQSVLFFADHRTKLRS
jgi:hypothetical protein